MENGVFRDRFYVEFFRLFVCLFPLMDFDHKVFFSVQKFKNLSFIDSLSILHRRFFFFSISHDIIYLWCVVIWWYRYTRNEKCNEYLYDVDILCVCLCLLQTSLRYVVLVVGWWSWWSWWWWCWWSNEIFKNRSIKKMKIYSMWTEIAVFFSYSWNLWTKKNLSSISPGYCSW